MAKPKYLLQERKGQRPHLHIWTPVLAVRKDMRPITEKEAEPYLHPEIPIEVEESEIEEAEEEEYVSDEDEDNKILDQLKPGAIKTSPLDGEGRPLEVTQEDILQEEVAKINRLRVKTSIEEYVFKKYKIKMIPMKEVDEMKQQAIELLSTLAATNTLYQ